MVKLNLFLAEFGWGCEGGDVLGERGALGDTAA